MSDYTVASGAALNLNGFNQTIGSLTGAGNVGLGSATLTTGADNTSTIFSGVISGAGGLAKIGAGAFTLTGASTYSGGTSLSLGTLGVGNNSALGLGGLAMANGTTLSFLNAANFNVPNAIQISGNATITPPSGTTQTLAGSISNGPSPGALNMSGLGMLVLSGASAYTGPTNVDSGVLRGGAANAFAPLSAFTVASGAALDLGGFNQAIGSLAGAGVVENSGAGLAVLTEGGDNASTVFSGVIKDDAPTGLTKTGAGTLTLSGTNTYTGPTNVDSGVLRGGAANAFAPLSAFTVASGAALDLGGFNQAIGSLAGAGVVENSGAGLAVLTEGGDNASTVFSGVIKDDAPTGLTKTGAGTLTLSGTNTYTGPTNVDSGTLNVAGSIASSSLTTVLGGATLTGPGATGATLIKSGGVLAPGSGVPGSAMSVLGGLTFNPGATYQVAINPATASLANVKGAASLGGEVLADFSPGSYLTRQYTILATTGGLGGTTFAGLSEVDAPPGFVETLTYDPDNAYLDLVGSLGAQGGLNINQQNVANAVNAAFDSGASLPPSFVDLYGLTGAAQGDALTQLTGEAATGARQGDFLFTDMFLSLLVDPDPYAENRGPGGASVPGAATGCSAEGGAELLAPDLTKKPQAALPCQPRWNVWAAGFGGGEQTSGDAAIGSHNAQIGAGGAAAGADYRLSPDATLGFALAGGSTNWSLLSALGGGDGKVFQGALYGAYQFGPAYLAGALTLGNYWLTTDRTVALSGGGTYRASFNSTDFGGRIESGYHVVLPPLTLTPYAAVQPQTFHAPSYAESAPVFGSSFALNYASQSATDTRFELGAWVDKSSRVARQWRAETVWKACVGLRLAEQSCVDGDIPERSDGKLRGQRREARAQPGADYGRRGMAARSKLVPDGQIRRGVRRWLRNLRRDRTHQLYLVR